LKALKARNEYLLAIDNANAAVIKYFKDDLPLLIEVGTVVFRLKGAYYARVYGFLCPEFVAVNLCIHTP
jgi:hypothetical protein